MTGDTWTAGLANGETRSLDRHAPVHGNDQASRRQPGSKRYPTAIHQAVTHTVSDRTDHPLTRACDDNDARGQTNTERRLRALILKAGREG